MYDGFNLVLLNPAQAALLHVAQNLNGAHTMLSLVPVPPYKGLFTHFYFT